MDLMKIVPRFKVPRNYRNMSVNFESVVKVQTREIETALLLFNEAKFTENVFHKFFAFGRY